MDLLLLQNADELEIAREKLGETFNKLKIIAWTPFAVDGLRKQNIPFNVASDYYDETYNSERLISFSIQLQKWCTIVDKNISQRVPEIASLKIHPFLNSIAPIRVLFYFYFNEMDKLQILLKKAKPSNVYYFYYVNTRKSILSRLMDVIGSNKWNVNFSVLTPISKIRSMLPDNLVKIDFDRERWWLKIIKFLLRSSRYKNMNSFLSGFSGCNLFRNGKPNILVLSVSRENRNALIVVKKRGKCNLIFWEDVMFHSFRDIDARAKDIVDGVKNNPLARQFIMHYGVDTFELYRSEIEHILTRYMPLFLSTVKRFCEMNEKFNFSLVLTAYECPEYEAIFDKCNDLNIPIAVFAHGGTVGPIKGNPVLPLCTRSDKNTSKIYYLVYSETMVDYCNGLRKFFPGCPAKSIPLGSSYFDGLLKRKSSANWVQRNEVKICYVDGGFGFSTRWMFDDDASKYRNRYNVVDILKEKPGITLYFKFGYNIEDYDLGLIRSITSSQWENVQAIPSGKKLDEILDFPDIFIIEQPSTTLFDVLTTSKPIILWVDSNILTLTEHAERLLKNRITLVKTREELELSLADIVENGVNAKAFTIPDHNDRTFMETFATCGDHNSIDRTVDFLQSIINKEG